MGDLVELKAPRRPRSSLFSGDFTPLRIRFMLGHWAEIISLADALSEESVRDLREALRYEWEHLRPGRIPCRCADGIRPPVVLGGGGGSTARSFSDIVPSIEVAYAELPYHWRGRTTVWLLMGGYTEQAIYDLRLPMIGRNRGPSRFDIEHRERLRTESVGGWQSRPQDTEPETDSSPWRRMAQTLGWVAPSEVQEATA